MQPRHACSVGNSVPRVERVPFHEQAVDCVRRVAMTWRDKLGIRLKGDAPVLKDSLPQEPVRGLELSNGSGHPSDTPLARDEHSGLTGRVAPRFPERSDWRSLGTGPDDDLDV
jgi:hypothetical protein